MQRLKIGSAWGVGCATETCSLEDDTVVTVVGLGDRIAMGFPYFFCLA